MYDVHVIFNDTPGELARFGQLLGSKGLGWKAVVYSALRHIFWWKTAKKPAMFCLRPDLT